MLSLPALAQNSIGGTISYGKGRFIDYTKDDSYKVKYPLSNVFSASAFYQTTIDSLYSLRFELQYGYEEAIMDVTYLSGHGSYQKKLDYTYQKVQLNLIYPLRIITRNSFDLVFNVGPSISYNLVSSAKKTEYGYMSVTWLDSAGNLVPGIAYGQITRAANEPSGLSAFIVGLNAGLELDLKVTNRLDLLIENRYTSTVSKVTTFSELPNQSFLTGSISVGIRYRLK
jgi:hypothetical protein